MLPPPPPTTPSSSTDFEFEELDSINSFSVISRLGLPQTNPHFLSINSPKDQYSPTSDWVSLKPRLTFLFSDPKLASQAPPTTTTPISSAPDFGVELTEDDIFWTNDFAAGSNHHHHHTKNNDHSTPHSSTPSRHHKGFPQPKSFEILAALPEAAAAARSSSAPPSSPGHIRSQQTGPRSKEIRIPTSSKG